MERDENLSGRIGITRERRRLCPAAVLPLIRQAEHRQEALTKATHLVTDALSRALPLLPASGSAEVAPPEVPAALERERRDEMARLAGLRGDEERREALDGELAGAERELDALGVREGEIAERLEALPQRLREAEPA